MTIADLGEPRTLELPSGAVLEYHDMGSGRPVVLLHGLVLHAGFWRRVAPALAKAHRCIVPTLPLGGHRHPLPADADLSPPALADLVAELLERLDLRDAVVVSNDTATALTQLLITRHPERVGGVVLTSGDAFRHFLPPQFRYLQVAARVPGAAAVTARTLSSAAARRSVLGFGLLTGAGIPDEVSGSYVENLRVPEVRRDLVKVLKGISTRHTLRAAEELPGFDKPALVVWGREDRLFPVRLAHRLGELLPQAEVVLVEGSRTYLPEDQPERLAELVLGFLRGTPA